MPGDPKKGGKLQPAISMLRPAMPAHGHLLDESDHVVGGIAKRGDEWALVLGSRTVTTTDSAAMAVAMLHRAASAGNASGRRLRSRYSDHLREAATREAEANGQTLERYLTALEAERVEHMKKKQPPQSPDSAH